MASGLSWFCGCGMLAVAVVLGCWCVDDVAGRARRSDDKVLLQRLVDAVQLGLDFFSQDYSNINVDGLFGMRLGQGQIIQALEECSRSSSCPDGLRRRLLEIKDEIDRTAKAAMGYVKAQDPEYFERFTQTIDNPYKLRYRPKMFKDLDKTPAGTNSEYDEESGDKCFARVMGTYVEKGKKVDKCNVTRACWDMMSELDRARYSVTHQLLYFIMTETSGCVEEVESIVNSRLQDIEDRQCASIYNEAQKETEKGNVKDIFQDLFLEQTVLCGCLGYENFMRRDWIEMVLSWQKPTGCFSMSDPYLLILEKQASSLVAMERKLMKDLQHEAQMIEEQHRHNTRKLLREQVMQDGCLSHKSGLGFGALCLYLRYLARQMFLQQ